MKPEYSIAAALRAKVANSWARVPSIEHDEHRHLVKQFGELESQHGIRLPAGALATRDMTVAGVSGSQFLVGTDQGEYLPTLAPYAAPLALGAQIVNVGRGNLAVPRGAAGATTFWLSDENTQITESQPTIGQIASAPKVLGANVEVTHQCLLQSNAEFVIRTELAIAAAKALTEAIIAGTGAAGQPTGVVNTAGVGAFTGATLSLAALRNAQEDIAASIVNRAAVGALTTPAVATLLAGRQRFTGSDRGLWEGASHEGTCEGVRAVTTTACPTATMVIADWSQCIVAEWAGGQTLLVDPFSKFNTGIVAIRLLLLVDVYLQRVAAFTVGGSIT